MIKEEYSFNFQLTQKVNMIFKVTWYFIWPQSHLDILYLSDQIVTQSNVK